MKSINERKLIFFNNEGISYLYTSAVDTHQLIFSRQQQFVVVAVIMNISYPYSDLFIMWQQNSPLGPLNSNERWRIDVISHSDSGAKISGGLAGCGKSGNGWLSISVDNSSYSL